METLLNILYVAVAFLVSVMVHENAHALAAYYLGDSTAKIEGRINLNPISHLDALGTVMFLLTYKAGWGKQVPVNSRNFKHPRRDSVLVALAGPMANFLLSFVLAFLMVIPFLYIDMVWPEVLMDLLRRVFTVSLYLGVVNLIPLPPFDGAIILRVFVPNKWKYEYDSFLENGTKYVLLAILFDWMILGKYIGFSIFGALLDSIVVGIQILVLLGF